MAGGFSVVDPTWELIDPNPDIFQLFSNFNETFFGGKLSSVYVKWSPRMTLCAGVCKFHPRNRECSIHLSKPLLSYRPRKDLVETLLHEMIHAYLFIADGNRERESHGPKFHEHMYRINKMTGANITVYHSFHDEVNHFKTHWWKCNGPCQHRSPFYGIVKRSMNRAPGPNDWWFKDHQKNCGGTFVKIKEPSPKKTVKRKKDATSSQSQKSQKTSQEGNENANKITNYFHSPTKTPAASSTATSSSASSSATFGTFGSPAPSQAPESASSSNNVEPFAGRGYVLGAIGNNPATANGSSALRNLFGSSTSSSASSAAKGGQAKLTGTALQSQPPRRGEHPLLAKWIQNRKEPSTASGGGFGFKKPENAPQSSRRDLWSDAGTSSNSFKTDMPSSSIPVKKTKVIEVIDLD